MTDKNTSPATDPQLDAGPRDRVELARRRARAGDGTATQSGATAPEAASSYSNYLFGSAGQTAKPMWSDSTQGRMAIRLVSRGIVGALAFTWGQRTAEKALRGYDPSLVSMKDLPQLAVKNPLVAIARVFDFTYGNAIGGGAKIAAHLTGHGTKAHDWAWQATRFRNKNWYHADNDNPAKAKKLAGRSLGAEMVAITFDFAMASIGDATTRNIFQALDPNNPAPWLMGSDGKPLWVKDKDGQLIKREGKAQIHWGLWAKSVGNATLRILGKNQGEDWAAALPYVYQMKWQRQALSKLAPGFKLSSDKSWNGGSIRLDENGEIISDYQLAGLLDLQGRFMGYNCYTLMYREFYDTMMRGFNDWKKNNFSLDFRLPQKPITSAIEGTAYGIRYVTKSIIKASLYMFPSVLFFWTWRTPQSKWRASNVMIEGDAVSNAYGTRTPGKSGVMEDNLPVFAHNEGKNLVMPAPLRNGPPLPKYQYFGDRIIKNKYADSSPYAWKMNKTWTSRILNPFGWVSYKSGTGASWAVDKFVKPDSLLSKAMGGSSNPEGMLQRELNVRTFVDAAYSYTPYMIAKAEFGLRVDDKPADGSLGEMDKSIYKLIDSALTFNLKDSKDALAHIFKLGLTMGRLEVQSREGTAASSAKPENETGTPVSRVETKNMTHTSPSAKKAANENEQAANDERPEGENRNWAESVTGRKLAAQFQSSSNSLH